MNLKKITFIISFYGLLFFSCHYKISKSNLNYYNKYPILLSKIIVNYQKLSLINYYFSLSYFSKGIIFSADGVAFFKKNKNRFFLKDTLFNKVILDCLIIDDKIQLYLNQSEKNIIKGRIGKFKLNRYFNLNFDIKTLLNLFSIKNFIFNNPDSIHKKNHSEGDIFVIQKNNKKKILQLYLRNKRPKKLVFLKENKEIYRIIYKKYWEKKYFYFPKRIDFYDFLTKSKIIIYVTNVKSELQNENKYFKIFNYPKANIIIDY